MESEGRVIRGQRYSTITQVLDENPVMKAHKEGLEYGRETAGQVVNPVIPDKYRNPDAVLLRAAYMNGVKVGRRDSNGRNKYSSSR